MTRAVLALWSRYRRSGSGPPVPSRLRRLAPATQAPAARPQAPRGRAAVQVDEERARRLYVSNRPADHAINYDFDGDVRAADAGRSALRRRQPRRHGLHEGDLPQLGRGHGHPRLPVPAAEEARARRSRRDGVGARRRARQLGHQHVPVRQGGSRARLRRHLPRVPRQHRLRREAPQRHRLRRLRSRRHDERRRVPEDAAARRSPNGWASWDGATAATSRCCRCSATARRSRRRRRWCRSPTSCSGSPTRDRAISTVSRPSSGSRGCRSRSRISTSSGRRCTTSTSCASRCWCTWRPTIPTSTSSRISRSSTRSAHASRISPRRASTSIRRLVRRASGTPSTVAPT